MTAANPRLRSGWSMLSSGGNGGSRHNAHRPAVNMIMSTVYAAANPEAATSAAPISGPRTKALLQAVVVSTFAAGNIEGFSKRGMIAVRRSEERRVGKE